MSHKQFLVKKVNVGITNANGDKLGGGGKIAQLKFGGPKLHNCQT
jgi:hypothetical protein